MNIGLIGAENSHTYSFCDAINKEKGFPGYAVTHIYGGDSPEACAKLVEAYGLIECASEEEVIQTCGALVITYRKGSLHYAPAMKALKAGKAVYNDKPFTTDVAQAREIVSYAKDNNLLLCGGSIVKDQSGLTAVQSKIKSDSTVIVSYNADPDSQYDGFWFYGIHAVETFVKLMGADYQSVSAFHDGGNVVASVNYGGRRGVIINSPGSKGVHVTVMNGTGTETESFPIPFDKAHTAPNQFVEMLKTGIPPYDYSFFANVTKLTADIAASAGL